MESSSNVPDSQDGELGGSLDRTCLYLDYSVLELSLASPPIKTTATQGNLFSSYLASQHHCNYCMSQCNCWPGWTRLFVVNVLPTWLYLLRQGVNLSLQISVPRNIVTDFLGLSMRFLWWHWPCPPSGNPIKRVTSYLRYQGPLLEDGTLEAAVSGGAESPEFTKLCAWIVSELKLYCKLEENVQATNCECFWLPAIERRRVEEAGFWKA